MARLSEMGAVVLIEVFIQHNFNNFLLMAHAF